MAAIALNSVKPLYHFSILGNIYAAQAMEDEDYSGSLKDAVATAIEKVRRNPSHD
jgi:competence protein ComFB